MKITRCCTSCGKDFIWDNECRCGKDKHQPVCNPCTEIKYKAILKNVAYQGTDALYDQITEKILGKLKNNESK